MDMSPITITHSLIFSVMFVEYLLYGRHSVDFRQVQ